MADDRSRRQTLPEIGDHVYFDVGIYDGEKVESKFIINAVTPHLLSGGTELSIHPDRNPEIISQLVQNTFPDKNQYPWVLKNSEKRYAIRFIPGIDDEYNFGYISPYFELSDIGEFERGWTAREQYNQENLNLLNIVELYVELIISLPGLGERGDIVDIISISSDIPEENKTKFNDIVGKIISYNLIDFDDFLLEHLISLAERDLENPELVETILSNYPGRRVKPAR